MRCVERARGPAPRRPSTTGGACGDHAASTFATRMGRGGRARGGRLARWRRCGVHRGSLAASPPSPPHRAVHREHDRVRAARARAGRWGRRRLPAPGRWTGARELERLAALRAGELHQGAHRALRDHPRRGARAQPHDSRADDRRVGWPRRLPAVGARRHRAARRGARQMLEVSDNNRTRELMRYFGVSALNRFARAIGLRHTHFETSPRPPGFNVIGCDSYAQGTLPPTLDGNTLSLADAATVWTRLVD